MKTIDEFELRSDDLGPRLAAWMASAIPPVEPAGLVAGAVGRTGSVRQRPAFLVRLRLLERRFALPDLSQRAQLVLVAGLLVAGIGVASAGGPRPSAPTHITGLSNSLIVLMPDGGSGDIRVLRPNGDVVGVLKGSTNGCGRHVLVADGTRVAIMSEGSPFRIAPFDGSDGVTGLPGPGSVLGSVFSPDRTRFAYLAGTSDRSDLTILSLADGTATVIVRNLRDASVSLLGWSVDDTLAIGFISETESRIDLVAADGTNYRTLVRQAKNGRSIREEMMVSWSPDGTRLAYARGGPNWPGDTWVIDIATGRSTLVATADGLPVYAWTNFANGLYFDWSPDGRLVTYRTNGRSALLDLATGESHIVPDAPGWVFWSPDGSRLAFLGQGDPARLTTFRADLSGRVDQIVEFGAQAIAWSPDSSQIAVLSGSVIDLLDPTGIDPPTRISNDVAPSQWYCLTWSEFDTP